MSKLEVAQNDSGNSIKKQKRDASGGALVV